MHSKTLETTEADYGRERFIDSRPPGLDTPIRSKTLETTEAGSDRERFIDSPPDRLDIQNAAAKTGSSNS